MLLARRKSFMGLKISLTFYGRWYHYDVGGKSLKCVWRAKPTAHKEHQKTLLFLVFRAFNGAFRTKKFAFWFLWDWKVKTCGRKEGVKGLKNVANRTRQLRRLYTEIFRADFTGVPKLSIYSDWIEWKIEFSPSSYYVWSFQGKFPAWWLTSPDSRHINVWLRLKIRYPLSEISIMSPLVWTIYDATELNFTIKKLTSGIVVFKA